METNKLDQLFREKLVENSTTPSPDAWRDLEVMLDKKKKKAVFWYYKVAASVLLLLASGFFTYWILSGGQELKPKMADKQQPIDIESGNGLQDRIAGEKTNSDSGLETEANKTNPEPEVVIEEVQPITTSPKEQLPRRQNIEIDLLADVDIQPESDMPKEMDAEVSKGELEGQVEEALVKKKPTVRIVYKSSAKKENKYKVVIMAKLDTAKRRRPDIREILRFPGQLLADVRSAKDDVFNPKEEAGQSGSQDFE
ncbi:MAG: hypothetical protein RIG77_19780 [Cyclobacteriaceae bacterium]